MFMQSRMALALGVSVCLLLLGMPPVAGQDTAGMTPDQVLAKLAEAMKEGAPTAQKRALLAETGKVSSLSALSLAIAATADQEVASEALTAAGQIAQNLMAEKHPAYIRRAAFMRWIACQPSADASRTAITVLRGRDELLQAAAVAFVTGHKDAKVREAVAKAAGSFAPSVALELVELAAGGDTGAMVAALAAMTRGDDKQTAAKAVKALGRLGNDRALAGVRAALAAADPGIRAAAVQTTTAWPNAAALPDLLGILRKPRDVRDTSLALNGIARLSGPSRKEAEGQQTLLAALGLVVEAASERELDEAATAAAVQVAHVLNVVRPEEARRALEKLSAGKLSDAARQTVKAALLLSTLDGLPNLALGAKASSPDGHDSQGPRLDAHAIDGKEDTYWDETDGHPLYRLRLDFKEPTQVSAISLMGWAHHNFSPRTFEIVCDDKVVRTVADAVYTDNRLIVSFPRTECASLELRITRHYGGSPGIRELGVFNAP